MYSRADAEAAVQTSQTMADVLRKVGLKPRGGNYAVMWAKLETWGIEAGHIRQHRQRWSYTDAELVEAINRSKSIAEAIRKLGRVPSTSGYRLFRDAIKRLNLDTSHLTGQGWAAGRRFPGKRTNATWYLGENRHVNSNRLRQALLRDGIKPHACEACGRRYWDGRPIPLELDHANGDRTDNRLKNLKLLCPNCHAFTPTYRGRNIGNAAGSKSN